MTDPELDHHLEHALAGDESAFTRVFRAVQPPLLRYLSVIVGSSHAEEIAAETWVRVARDLQRFRGDAGGFRAWVFTIARHRALDHRRAEARRPPLTDDRALESLPGQSGVAEAVEEIISTEAALRLVAQLPHDQAEAVLLRVVAGLDVARAAQVLGKRPGTVRVLAHRGLRRLGDMVERADVAPLSLVRGVTEAGT